MMSTVIFSIDPSQGYLNFLFYVCISAALGAAVYLLMRRPGLRRAEFRSITGGPSTLRNALLCSLAVALPFLIYGYTDSWQHFFTLRVTDDKLIADYLFPSRSREITDISGLTATAEYEVRKGVNCRIILKQKNGPAYSSQLMGRTQAEAHLAALRRELQKRNNRKPGESAAHQGD